MKTALIVRHVEREGAAGYLDPMEAAGYRIERLNIAEPGMADAADLIAPDLLVVMGGAMGVYDAPDLPWMRVELQKLGDRLARELPTLGVCLGSQMIASALGAKVYKGEAPEIGFAPLALTEAGRTSPIAALDGTRVLHWHGDTFDLPSGAELLAATPSYAHQAFSCGSNILALQFHAEMGEDPRFELWLDHFHRDFGSCPDFEAQLRADHEAHGPAAVAAGRAMIAAWLSGLKAA